MSKTSWQAKARYNSRAYEQITIRVRMGTRERVKLLARSMGMSTNAYINHLIWQDEAYYLEVEEDRRERECEK